MLQETCNIWDKWKQGHTVCITTNGYIRANGQAVMGRGTAKQAIEYVPDIEAKLGQAIKRNGNVVQKIASRIISFPVKPEQGICNQDRTNIVSHMRYKFNPGHIVPGWAMMASLELIKQSLWTLYLGHIIKPKYQFFLPKPGCGAGGLEWDIVYILCAKYGDWLVVCDLKG